MPLTKTRPKMTARNTRTMTNLNDFIDYCQDFYDKDRLGAIYPFATKTEIRNACLAHTTDPNPAFPFDGDTIDREAVRDRILAGRVILGIGETDFARAVNSELAKQGKPESCFIKTILPDGTLVIA